MLASRKPMVIAVMVTALIGLVIAPVRAQKQKPPATDWSKGALYGKVVDAASGQPVAGATVALQDKNGKVVAWTKTDKDGQYAIAAETMKVLQLQPSRRRGLLAQIARGVGAVVTAPIRAADAAVKGAASVVRQVDPVNTAKAAAVSAATGNPVPLAAQVTGKAIDAAAEQAEKRARENAVKAALGERLATPKEKRDEPVPGEVRLLVSAPNFKEVRGKAGAYWLEPPALSEDGKKISVGPRAWLETVRLAPAGSDKNSEIENVAVLLAEPQAEPTLVPAGTPVQLRVKLQTPGNQPMNVRVFARDNKKGAVAELKPQGENIYAGELTLDPKTPAGDTKIAIAALRAEPVEVNLRESKADPLLDFVQRLDEMEADKPYDFDPRILASENRLDVTLTVLDPGQGTPASPAAAPTPPPAAPEKPAAPAQPEQPAQPAAPAQPAQPEPPSPAPK